MTIYNWLKQQLTDCAVWPDEAEAILQQVIAYDDKHGKAMTGLWHDRKDSHPVQTVAALWQRTILTAVPYLKETKPKHVAIYVLEQELKSA